MVSSQPECDWRSICPYITFLLFEIALFSISQSLWYYWRNFLMQFSSRLLSVMQYMSMIHFVEVSLSLLKAAVLSLRSFLNNRFLRERGTASTSHAGCLIFLFSLSFIFDNFPHDTWISLITLKCYLLFEFFIRPEGPFLLDS